MFLLYLLIATKKKAIELTSVNLCKPSRILYIKNTHYCLKHKEKNTNFMSLCTWWPSNFISAKTKSKRWIIVQPKKIQKFDKHMLEPTRSFTSKRSLIWVLFVKLEYDLFQFDHHHFHNPHMEMTGLGLWLDRDSKWKFLK